MSFFQKFSFQAEKQFAASLAKQLVKDLPPTTVRERLHTLSANRITRMLERLFAKLDDAPEVGGGVIARAILANQFRWALHDAGYQKEFVDLAVEGLVVEALRRQRIAKP